MSGMNVSGAVLVQEPQANGFIAYVYPNRVAAAIQLLRVAIRQATDPKLLIAHIEHEVKDLVASEQEENDEL